MSFWDKVKSITTPYSDEDYDEYDEEEEGTEGFAEEPTQQRTQRRRPNFTMNDDEPDTGSSTTGTAGTASAGFTGHVVGGTNSKQEVVLFHARTFDDAARAADELRRRKAVILNMENVDKALTRRVVDFLSGSVYALDGSVKKIAQSTYLFCPHNMDVVGDLENIQSEIESYI